MSASCWAPRASTRASKDDWWRSALEQGLPRYINLVCHPGDSEGCPRVVQGTWSRYLWHVQVHTFRRYSFVVQLASNELPAFKTLYNVVNNENITLEHIGCAHEARQWSLSNRTVLLSWLTPEIVSVHQHGLSRRCCTLRRRLLPSGLDLKAKKIHGPTIELSTTSTTDLERWKEISK